MSTRSVRRTNNAVPGAVITVGCLYLIAAVAFWVTVVVIVLHFVAKLW
jgi:hypothetical protein